MDFGDVHALTHVESGELDRWAIDEANLLAVVAWSRRISEVVRDGLERGLIRSHGREGSGEVEHGDIRSMDGAPLGLIGTSDTQRVAAGSLRASLGMGRREGSLESDGWCV